MSKEHFADTRPASRTTPYSFLSSFLPSMLAIALYLYLWSFSSTSPTIMMLFLFFSLCMIATKVIFKPIRLFLSIRTSRSGSPSDSFYRHLNSPSQQSLETAASIAHYPASLSLSSGRNMHFFNTSAPCWTLLYLQRTRVPCTPLQFRQGLRRALCAVSERDNGHVHDFGSV
jgi:hypothetical protein